MIFVRQYAGPVLRRWVVVLAAVLLGVAGTLAYALTQAPTLWTATSALTTQSQTRAPEQDAVLTLGYVDYFNQPTYQQVLRAEARIPADVILKAETGAASPILYVEAKASTAEAARSASKAAAEAFRLDVRNGLVAERQREIDDLQKQVDDAVAELQKPGTTAAEGNVILGQIQSLQGRITDISGDATNHLKTLQEEPGLASSVPSLWLTLLAGGFSGLLLGVLLALALAMLDDRIRAAADVASLGPSTLIDGPRQWSRTDRTRDVERLLNALDHRAEGTRIALAVVGVGTPLGHRWARALAEVAAGRRTKAVLVRADLRTGGDAAAPGFAEVLSGAVDLDQVLDREPSGLAFLHTGDAAGRDPYVVVDPSGTAGLLTRLTMVAGVVVVDPAPLERAPETQVICSAVDQVILVVERGVTRKSELRQAVEQLEAVGAAVVGVVIDSVPAPAKPGAGEPATATVESTTVETAKTETAKTETAKAPDHGDTVEVSSEAVDHGPNGSSTNGPATNGSATNGSGGAATNGSNGTGTNGGTAFRPSPRPRLAPVPSGSGDERSDTD